MGTGNFLRDREREEKQQPSLRKIKPGVTRLFYTFSSNIAAINRMRRYAHETACRVDSPQQVSQFQYKLYKAEILTQTMSLASLWARVESPAHHSTILVFESLDLLVLCRYDHIHAPLCDAGVAYTLRKSSPTRSLWLA